MYYAHMGEEQVLDNLKQYGPSAGGEAMMNFENQHAQEALESGIYVSYFNQSKNIECARVGSKSKCFCGHKYADHALICTKKKLANPCKNCPCKMFANIPQRPEECGMYWLPRRKNFKVSEWRAKCKCDNGHDLHTPNYPRTMKKGGCSGFWSDFACISCDGRWEDHETIYEFEHDRLAAGKKVGPDYCPLSMNKELQGLMFDPEQRKTLPNYNRPAPKKKAIMSNKQPQGQTLAMKKHALDFGRNEGLGSNPKYLEDDYYKVPTFKNDGTFKSLTPMNNYSKPQNNNNTYNNDQPFPVSKNCGNDQPFPQPKHYR